MINSIIPTGFFIRHQIPIKTTIIQVSPVFWANRKCNIILCLLKVENVFELLQIRRTQHTTYYNSTSNTLLFKRKYVGKLIKTWCLTCFFLLFAFLLRAFLFSFANIISFAIAQSICPLFIVHGA